MVLWKQGYRVITAGSVKVRKDDRLALVEADSLRIIMVDVADAGQFEFRKLILLVVRMVNGNVLAGNYTCEVEWGGHPKQIVHTLEVHVPPHVEAILPSGYGQVNK